MINITKKYLLTFFMLINAFFNVKLMLIYVNWLFWINDWRRLGKKILFNYSVETIDNQEVS